jgi:ABC-type cobalamin/Fe3+-siderophores transport system ATPase subunit
MFATMSALEIIEQIKALPQEEQATVVQFIHQLEAGGASPAKGIHFATPGEAAAAGDKVLRQYAEVFRKLAQ